MNKEIFKTIPDFSDYMVSDFGTMKSLKFGKERILKPAPDKDGYLQVVLYKNGKGKTLKVHQLMMITFKNYIPNGMNIVIDHENNIKTDNRLDNFQVISQRKNCSKDKKGSSKYNGVSWHKRDKKFQSRIYVNGKRKHLGYFNNEIDASNTYQKELKKTLLIKNQ